MLVVYGTWFIRNVSGEIFTAFISYTVCVEDTSKVIFVSMTLKIIMFNYSYISSDGLNHIFIHTIHSYSIVVTNLVVLNMDKAIFFRNCDHVHWTCCFLCSLICRLNFQLTKKDHVKMFCETNDHESQQTQINLIFWNNFIWYIRTES